MRALIAVGAMAVLAGCGSNPEREARINAMYDQKCRSYGAVPGSQAYFYCRMTLEREDNAASQAYGRQMQAVGASLMLGR